MSREIILAVAGVMLLASTVRSTFGFGEALVSVPILALLIPIRTAAPVAVLASIVVAALVMLQDWRHVEFRSAGWLVFSTAFGIPLGLWLLKSIDEPIVKTLLALMILAFSAHSLIRRARPELGDDRLAWAFGFAAGVFGGAYGLNGPPLAVYGSLRGWSPTRFRATLQGYFLPASLLGFCGYFASGLCTPEVERLFAWSLPSIFVGTWLGGWINRRIEPSRFRQFVHVGLVLIGLVLLGQVVGSR